MVWASNERLAVLLDEAGHLTGAPELAVEVLSPGVEMSAGIEKLNQLTHAGGTEYWIADWRLQQVPSTDAKMPHWYWWQRC